MNKLGVEESLETHAGLLGRVLEGLEQRGHDGLDLGVADDRADLLQGLHASLLDLVMGVAQNLGYKNGNC